MTEMSNSEIRRFLMKDTFTGKLATVKKDGSSHVVPIWFVLDEKNSRGKLGDFVFTTDDTSVKANNIRRKNRDCRDDQTPQFSFVTVFGIVKYTTANKEILKWVTKIAERYGKE
jgi:nitroimidazol reductase NimA-like FMN-containing flavoprotein (pyridoxamine 5'-phosphate oxidase superfamily)